MSARRRRDVKFPGVGRRELQRRVLPPSKPWTLREKLVVFSSLALAVLIFCSPYLGGMIRERRLVSSRVESWREKFQLDQSQVQRLMDLEYEYHGSGNPFAPQRRFSDVEREDHNLKIAEIMGQGTGRNFLVDESVTPH